MHTYRTHAGPGWLRVDLPSLLQPNSRTGAWLLLLESKVVCCIGASHDHTEQADKFGAFPPEIEARYVLACAQLEENQ